MREAERALKSIEALLPLWPGELDCQTVDCRQRLLRRLRAQLRAERRRGLAGHWTYDLARHAELLRLYRHIERGEAGAR
jgi:hypothetical protein